MLGNVYNCSLKTLSPIHIGAGKDYGPSEYISGKARLKGDTVDIIKCVDLGKYYSTLDEDKKDDFLVGLTDSNFKLDQFDRKIKKEFIRYRSIDKTKIGKTNNDKPINSIKDISEHIKTMDQLYIPGSSIKGAVKTAIFYNLIDYKDISKISNLIKSGSYGKYIDKWGYNNWLDNYFSAKKGNSAQRRNSAQRSIMKFLQVSDTSTIKVPTIENVVSVMASDSSKEKNQYYSRRGFTVRSFLETIAVGKKLKTRFVSNFDSNIYKTLGLNDKKELVDIDYIKKVLFEFSRDLIEYEWDFAEKYDISYLLNFYKKLSKINSIDTPLIRVGSGSGLMATSILMKVKNKDSNTFTEIRNTFEKQYSFEFPKSRKVTVHGKPLGWMKLEIE